MIRVNLQLKRNIVPRISVFGLLICIQTDYVQTVYGLTSIFYSISSVYCSVFCHCEFHYNTLRIDSDGDNCFINPPHTLNKILLYNNISVFFLSLICQQSVRSNKLNFNYNLPHIILTNCSGNRSKNLRDHDFLLINCGVQSCLTKQSEGYL